MKFKNVKILAVCVIILIGIVFLNACKGVDVNPNDNGGVTITPIDPEDKPSEEGNRGETENTAPDVTLISICLLIL